MADPQTNHGFLPERIAQFREITGREPDLDAIARKGAEAEALTKNSVPLHSADMAQMMSFRTAYRFLRGEIDAFETLPAVRPPSKDKT